jgi:tetratricopeptide (TPR) repeat protein
LPRDGSSELSPRSGTLLAAYFDLHTDEGPLHARSVADVGRCFLAGLPIPAYQCVTGSDLRGLITADAPELPNIDDPRELDRPRRSREWEYLCGQLGKWDELPDDRRLATAQVLFKLGFWQTLALLPLTMPGADADPAAAGWQLARIRYSASMKLQGRDDFVLPPELRDVFVRLARDDGSPLAKRLGAAVNLLVHHARYERSRQEIAGWHDVARGLVGAAAPGDLSLVLLSAYWRGCSFAPFFDDDHAQVASMLDEAELTATRAVDQAEPDQRVLALENLRLVLMTRARAAAGAGDQIAEESYLRRLARLDPLDSHAHVLLAGFLLKAGRLDEARSSYLAAARLGAPFTEFAQLQALRCAASAAGLTV